MAGLILRRQKMKRIHWLVALVWLQAVMAVAAEEPPPNPLEQDVTQGALRVKTDQGGVVECPLKHTDVKAVISGFIARVTVTQTFSNPYNEKIEAVYVFPLPHTAAVDDMTMEIGERKIVGVIKRRAEARAIYEQAVAAGMTASLLEQERPNIFTQSVGNIKPGQDINIVISYVDVLKYDMGTYEFHFPMVVGPRYIPGGPISSKPVIPPELQGKVGETRETAVNPAAGNKPSGTGWSADTDRVKDASRITPPVLKPGFRTGHDISLSVQLDAGVPVHDIQFPNHGVKMERIDQARAAAVLSDQDSIPNKDFTMKYTVVGAEPTMATLAHMRGAGDGYFMLMIQPRLDDSLPKAPPREIVFLIDVSGSMSGEPTEKVKQTMREFFKRSKKNDTIQVITFAGSASKLFDKPVTATADNVKRALNFTDGIRGGGGTEMLKGIKMTLEEPPDPERVRIVVMLTDGFIGNEAEIIKEVGERAGDQVRFWCLGIGSSPNRFLLDGVAKQGGGMSDVIELNTDPSELVGRIVERIHRAQLAKIQIDWAGLPVLDTYPRRIPELWAGRPVIVFGRYRHGSNAMIRVSGVAEGKPISYTLPVGLPAVAMEHDVLAQVWARRKIEDLSEQMYYGDDPEVVEEITALALDYRLMSQYTSFVAVDESERGQLTEPARPPRRMLVPVPLPAGVSYEGVFGELDAESEVLEQAKPGLGYGYGVAMAGRSPASPVPPAKMSPDSGVNRPYRMGNRKSEGGRGYWGFTSKNMLSRSAGSPAPSTPMMAPSPAVAEPVSDYDRGDLRGRQVEMFQQASASWHGLATNLVAKAEVQRKEEKLDEAWRLYQQAMLFERAYLSVHPRKDTGLIGLTEESLVKLAEEMQQARAKEYPVLAKKLDLVINRQSLESALEQIVWSAGIQYEIVAGSTDDAAEMLGMSGLRVAYMDLRRATVAQALDWLLAPMQLTWQMKSKDTVLIGTARRLPGVSAWTYAVGDLAIPTQQELGDKDQAKKLEAALKELAGAMASAVGKDSVTLTGPDLLLVVGDKDKHAEVAAILEVLKTGVLGGLVHGEIAALMSKTAPRWQARTEERKKRLAALAEHRVLRALEEYPWQLLAAAQRGELNAEALAELGEIWDNPAMNDVMKGPHAVRAMRGAWVYTELGQLDKPPRREIDGAFAVARNHAAAALASNNQLDKLYTLLVLRDDKKSVETVKQLRKQIEQSKGMESILMVTLVAPTAETDAALIGALKEGKFNGNDQMVLAARCAMGRGGDVWNVFRQELPDISGKQPLNGHVIVYMNRLEPVLTTRK
jgi:Ca-activated chloride channel family protein